MKIDHTSGLTLYPGYQLVQESYDLDQLKIDHTNGLTLHPWTIKAGSTVVTLGSHPVAEKGSGPFHSCHFIRGLALTYTFPETTKLPDVLRISRPGIRHYTIQQKYGVSSQLHGPVRPLLRQVEVGLSSVCSDDEQTKGATEYRRTIQIKTVQPLEHENKMGRSLFFSSHVVLTLSPSEVDPAKQRDRFQLAKWVPGGSGRALAVVYRNDIYYIADVERPESFVRVTSGGKGGVVFNGIPDWLYEGERCASPLQLHGMNEPVQWARPAEWRFEKFERER